MAGSAREWTQDEIDADMGLNDDNICSCCGGEGFIDGDCTCMDDTCCCLNPTPPTCSECKGLGYFPIVHPAPEGGDEPATPAPQPDTVKE